MSDNLFNVTGIAKYAKVFPRNKDNNEAFHGPDGAYTINVVLDKENLDIVSKSGSRLKPKLTDDGVEIKFKRKHTNEAIPAFGGAPKVVDGNDELWDEEVSIGNGSKVEVWFSVYDTSMGKGTRLEGIRVLDLVEWEGDEERKQVELPF